MVIRCERVLAAIMEAFRTGQYEVEYRTLRPDGTTYWTAARGMVVYEGGEPQRMLGICMDVTARKRAEQALVRAEKLATAGRLAATVAHEINNPLEAVTNLVYLARHTDQDPKPLLDLVDRELSRVAAITRQASGSTAMPALPCKWTSRPCWRKWRACTAPGWKQAHPRRGAARSAAHRAGQSRRPPPGIRQSRA